MCIDSGKCRKQSYNTPAIGYRAFKLGDNSRPILHSLFSRYQWKNPKESTDDDPREYEDYGFHALNTLNAVMKYYYYYQFIFAKVRGSGIVVRHRTGFRASKMRILKLYLHLDRYRGLTHLYSDSAKRQALKEPFFYARHLTRKYGVKVEIM